MHEDESTPGETGGHSFNSLIEGGILRVVAGRPMQLAISRLVSGAVAVPEALFEIPVAYLNGITERIRSDTEARRQLSATVLAGAKHLAAADESLTNRAFQRWSSNLGSKQRNVEKVAERTMDLMAGLELPESAQAPSEEFMGPFGDIAENASSDEMADLLARILVGEIHQPGTFSRRTLQTVSVLDKRSVNAFIEILPYLISGDWIYIPPKEQHIWTLRLSILSIVGVTTEPGIRSLLHDDAYKGALRFGSKAVVYTCKPTLTGAFLVDGASLTLVGKELLTALPPPEAPNINQVAQRLKEHSFIINVAIGDVVEAGDRFNVENCLEVS